jgi:hypothetical protein
VTNELPSNVTEEQRRAIQAFVHSAITPLIEEVIVKKLGQAAIVLRDELSDENTRAAVEQAGGGEVNDLTRSAAMLAVDRAEFRIVSEKAPRLILKAIAEQFDEMAQAAREDDEFERRDVWRNAASQARARSNDAEWIAAALQENAP